MTAPGEASSPSVPAGAIELLPSHDAVVAGTRVRRALPQRLGPERRRTVGAWCFADHLGPVTVSAEHGMEVGPHPHTGLQTVTWLTAGELLHRDSLGSEQLIRPGQLNLMTAGHGVSHSEESTPAGAGRLEGIQLWVAQPEATRHGDAAFEHQAELPRFDTGPAEVTVLVGECGAVTSPARRDTDHVGLQLQLRPGQVTLPAVPTFEYAVVVLEGAARLRTSGGAPVVATPGQLAYVGSGHDELEVQAEASARLMLLGGTPFEAPVIMWWNFVGRTRDEVAVARRDWQAGSERFGVTASPLARIPAPDLPWAS